MKKLIIKIFQIFFIRSVQIQAISRPISLSIPATIMFHLFMSVLLCTYVGIRSFRLRLHGLSRLEQICWNMLIEVAHCEKSNLFLQSEPVTEKENKC